MARPFHFDRTWDFPLAPHDLWETLGRTDAYPDWWSWLEAFEADGLYTGSVARCTIRAPLPYRLGLRIEVLEEVPARLIRTQVSGDLAGPARLEVASAAGGCRARLVWELHLERPMLRGLATVARPAMTWAHDQVVDLGVRRFRERALAGAGPGR